jgi:hypothetical protein
MGFWKKMLHRNFSGGRAFFHPQQLTISPLIISNHYCKGGGPSLPDAELNTNKKSPL